MAPSINFVPESPAASEQRFKKYDHITWYVSNAKQSASFYATKFGFTIDGFRGLETGSPDITAYSVRLGGIRMVFMSALRSEATRVDDMEIVREIHRHVREHGDGVKDVAFEVNDVVGVYNHAIAAGSGSVLPPTNFTDAFGTVGMATIKAYGDTTHTILNRDNYRGCFLPGFRSVKDTSNLDDALGKTMLYDFDHCVANQGWNQMDETCAFYERTFGFHRFWSVDDKQICTEFSALNSVVVASKGDKIKMPINEPAVGKKKSQIEEFIDFYGGPGIQHIALITEDIISTIKVLRARGVEFISVPSTYYEQLKVRLAASPVRVQEDLTELQRLEILVDFDNDGYLLQLFTKPVVDRPTVFIEIIQRRNFEGFGAGNFKSLFEAIEREQELRGTL